MPDDKLMTYFKFDESDLQANRDGRLSEKQTHQLAALDRSDRIGRVVIGWLCLGMALAGLVGGVWLAFSEQDLISKLGWAAFGLPCLLIFTALGIYLLRTAAAPGKKYKLGHAQGQVRYSRHVMVPSRRTVYGYQLMHVGTTLFTVGNELPALMPADASYNVYYYSRQGSSKILTAERLADPS